MRILTTFAAFAALAFASPAFAQSHSPRSQSDGASAPAAQPEPRFTKVEIVDVKDLPPTTQTQVNAMIAKSNPEDLQALRSSIDASPQALTALRAKGLNSSQVLAANIDDKGTLTLITKLT